MRLSLMTNDECDVLIVESADDHVKASFAIPAQKVPTHLSALVGAAHEIGVDVDSWLKQEIDKWQTKK